MYIIGKGTVIKTMSVIETITPSKLYTSISGKIDQHNDMLVMEKGLTSKMFVMETGFNIKPESII